MKIYSSPRVAKIKRELILLLYYIIMKPNSFKNAIQTLNDLFNILETLLNTQIRIHIKITKQYDITEEELVCTLRAFWRAYPNII